MFGCCTWLYAPPSFLLVFSSSSPCKLSRCGFPMATPIKIAIVNDGHDCWSLKEDKKALQFFEVGPGYSSRAGEFGNENVDLVESISNLNIPKAIILGNHDAWSTQKFSSIGKDPVHMQLKSLGEEHVGYRLMDFPIFNLSIVCGRPFSCGSDRGTYLIWYQERYLVIDKKELVCRVYIYCMLHPLVDKPVYAWADFTFSSIIYGVDNVDGSAKWIYKVALGTPAGYSMIFLAHNGVTDLAKAISQLKDTTEFLTMLVVFGHMHKEELVYGKGLRKMLVVGDDKVIYLNGAIAQGLNQL